MNYVITAIIAVVFLGIGYFSGARRASKQIEAIKAMGDIFKDFDRHS